MPNQSHADHLKRWDLALVAAEANASEPGVDDLRQQLRTAAEGARVNLAKRNLLRFQLQQTSRDLDAFVATGKELFSRLVLVVRGRYGQKAEKLNEFGLQPRRPPQVTTEKKVKRFLEKERKEKPPENGVEPTRAADSQIDSAS